MIDRVVHLAERLRAAGFEVSTGEVIDAVEALQAIDLADRRHVRAALRATLVKEHDPLGRFDAGVRRAVRRRRHRRRPSPTRPLVRSADRRARVGGPVDGAVLAALAHRRRRCARLARRAGGRPLRRPRRRRRVGRQGAAPGAAGGRPVAHAQRGHAPAAPNGRPRRARPADAPPRHRRPPGCVPPPTGQGHRRPDRPADRVTRPPGDAGRRARPAAPVDSRARRVAARPAAVAPPARGAPRAGGGGDRPVVSICAARSAGRCSRVESRSTSPRAVGTRTDQTWSCCAT